MQQAEKEENTVLNKLNLNNAVTKEFNATVLMHIKRRGCKNLKNACIDLIIYCYTWAKICSYRPGIFS
jgi:hypothetical protein